MITGATSGIGLACARKFAENGDQLILTGRNEQRLEEIRKELTDKGTKVLTLVFDVRNREDARQCIDELPDEWKEIDVLVNNAYIGNPIGTYFHKTDSKDYLAAFQNNVLPLIKVTQTCIIGMRKRKFGKIVNIITSYLIDVPPTGFSVYTATKAYIRQLSRSISREYGRFNITSNCVLPDFMNTGFGHVEDFQLEQMKSTHPLKELLDPSEVAEVVYHLIKSSQQINGIDIPINAGQHMM
jgi:NADP-dependent 3-hydroxy acid dehydrogenase YdfG